MTANGELTSIKGEWRQGWPIVVAGALGFGTGVGLIIQLYTFFITPMRQDLGWSLQALSLGPLLHFSLAIFSPAGGWLVDRWGARRSFLAGLSLIGCCTVALAVAPATPLFLYSIVILIGAIGPLTGTIPTVRGVVSWFRGHPGGAIGLAMNGTSVVSLIAIPIVSTCLYYYGWRIGFLALAGFIFFIGLPAVFLFFRERAEAVSPDLMTISTIDGVSVKEACHSLKFWLVLSACTFGALGIGGILYHLQPLLAAQGFGLTEAAFLGMLYSISIIIGRAGGGFLLDHLNPELVALLLFLLAAMGAFSLGLISVSSPILIVSIAVLLVGMGQGAEGDFVAFFTFKHFGMHRYATLVGFITLSVGLGFSLGGFLFAAIFDRWQNYGVATQFAASCFAIAGLLIIMTRFARSPNDAK